MEIIHAESLTRMYTVGDLQVVGIRDMNLTIEQGQFVVLKGRSGSGKSTLLSLLAGLDTPTHGRLLVASQQLNRASPDQLTRFRRETVGMVFQNFNLLPTLTVLENVQLPGLLASRSKSAISRRAERLLEQLGMAPRRHHLPSQLSGGEMQRTAIARALINDPPLILADEPTGNLDSQNGKAVIELLSMLHQHDGRTVVMATHGHFADACATRQIQLEDGQIIGE